MSEQHPARLLLLGLDLGQKLQERLAGAHEERVAIAQAAPAVRRNPHIALATLLHP